MEGLRLFARLDAELTDAVQQRHAQLLVQVFIKHTVDDGLLHQQRLIEFQDGLLSLGVIVLSPGHQVLKIHVIPHSSFFSFRIAR